jgi:hypothetical protein
VVLEAAEADEPDHLGDARRVSGSSRRTSSPNAMFCATVRQGNRLKPWKITARVCSGAETHAHRSARCLASRVEPMRCA